jgi:hypothetical protein
MPKAPADFETELADLILKHHNLGTSPEDIRAALEDALGEVDDDNGEDDNESA